MNDFIACFMIGRPTRVGSEDVQPPLCDRTAACDIPSWKNALRRLLKFLHTLGAVGLMGAMAALAVVIALAPSSMGTVSYVLLMNTMARIAAWIIMPSIVLTIVAGLLAMAVTPGFQDAGWVWVKAATGILILEGGLHVMGPIQEETKRGAGALASSLDPVSVAHLFLAERNTLWVLLAVSAANIALGVWRPRLPKMPL